MKSSSKEPSKEPEIVEMEAIEISVAGGAIQVWRRECERSGAQARAARSARRRAALGAADGQHRFWPWENAGGKVRGRPPRAALTVIAPRRYRGRDRGKPWSAMRVPRRPPPRRFGGEGGGSTRTGCWRIGFHRPVLKHGPRSTTTARVAGWQTPRRNEGEGTVGC